MALYFLRGSLPSQGRWAANQHTRDELVLEQKQQIGVGERVQGLTGGVCHLHELPPAAPKPQQTRLRVFAETL